MHFLYMCDTFIISLPTLLPVSWSPYCDDSDWLCCNVPRQHVTQEGAGVYRSPRALRPQLGLGAVTRQPAAKTRVQQTGQRSATAAGASTQGYQDSAGETVICIVQSEVHLHVASAYVFFIICS